MISAVREPCRFCEPEITVRELARMAARAAGSVDVIEVFNAKVADQALNDEAARLAW
jgi:hypothetical protein